jgi:hypothetical protein
MRLVAGAIIAGSLIVSASLLFIGRWQISGAATPETGVFNVFRLNRWTGKVEYCGADPYAVPFPKIVCPVGTH